MAGVWLPVLSPAQITQKWSATFNYQTNLSDAADAVAVDSAGNVFVTGYVTKAAGNSDIVTLKYNAAGAQLWTKLYDGPPARNDRGSAVVVDASGNVYITGASTEKYGNVYNSDIYTAKYAGGNGSLIWERRKNGPNNDNDEGMALTLAANGDVLVAGRAYATNGGDNMYATRYNSTGTNQFWECYYVAPNSSNNVASAVAVDQNGDVFTAGRAIGSTTGFDFFTAKISGSNGAVIWAQLHNGSRDGNDGANALVVDQAGNVIVTGYAVENFTEDFYTVKYAAATGDVVWERRYNGTGNGQDGARSLALDAAGNVFVTGYSRGTANDDFYTAKYSASNGAILWERRYNGPDNGYDTAFKIAVDGNGDAIVAGDSASTANGSDAYTAKYSGIDGSIIWEKRYNVSGTSSEGVRGLSLTPTGGAVIAGFVYVGGVADVLIVDYEPASSLSAWRQANFGSTANSGNGADNADPDKDGNVNYIEWAQATNPNVPNPAPIAATKSGGDLIFTYQRNVMALATGTPFIVEWSETLQAGDWHVAGVTQTSLSSDGALEKVKAVITSASNALFVRLRVTN